ncbi:MAG: Crp/Fnr family transcriptional regulator [Rubrobacter sp.]
MRVMPSETRRVRASGPLLQRGQATRTRAGEPLQELVLASIQKAGIPAVERRFAPRELVYSRGEPDRGLCVLLEGTLRVYKPYGSFREATVGLLKDGGLFGEPTLRPGGRHRDSAEALSACRVARVPKGYLENHLRQESGCAVSLMLIFAEWARRREATIARLLARRVGDRLATLLLELAESLGVETEQGTLLDIRLTLQDLAELVACTREAVSKEISNFRRAGAIEVCDHKIVVLDGRWLATRAEDGSKGTFPPPTA